MKATHFPTLQEALELHKQLLSRFGGTAGIRDLGLLESALARPRSGYYDTLYLQAAALLQSLVLNHSFVDGNKRMAMALPLIFLRMHKIRIKILPDEGESFLIDQVIKKKVDIKVIATWLEKNSIK